MKFSQHFGLNIGQEDLEFLDILIDTDLKLAVDPFAIQLSNSRMAKGLVSLLQSFFTLVLSHIKNKDHDAATDLLSSLSEANEYHLGYSQGRSQGRGFGAKSADLVWQALIRSRASRSGALRDLEDCALLIKGIDRDRISDAVCNICRGPLINYTIRICNKYGIEMQSGVESGPIWNPESKIWEDKKVSLPVVDSKKIILVPIDFVRRKLVLRTDNFYLDFMVPVYRARHMRAGGGLVSILKDGTRKVTLVAIKGKYPSTKEAMIQEILVNPEYYIKFKNSIKNKPPGSLSDAEWEELSQSSWAVIRPKRKK